MQIIATVGRKKRGRDKSLLKSVRRFAWLWWLHILVALGGLALLPKSAFLSSHGVTFPMQMGMYGFGTIILALMLLPFWFAVRRGRSWARWVLFAGFAISMPNLLLDPSGFQAAWIPFTSTTILSTIVNAAAFYFLFSTESQLWFAKSMRS